MRNLSFPLHHISPKAIASSFLLLICLAFAVPAYADFTESETAIEWKAEQDQEDATGQEFMAHLKAVLSKERVRSNALIHQMHWTGTEVLPIPTPPPESPSSH